jgi:hypothetical protein
MDNTKCKICGKVCEHLGSHIAKGHKMTCREYKEEFGLDYNFPLISPEVKRKKQEAFELNRQKYLANLTHSEQYQFKKGMTNKIRISTQSKERHANQLENIEQNKSGVCEICHMNYTHLASHLYNKHGLVVAKK